MSETYCHCEQLPIFRGSPKLQSFACVPSSLLGMCELPGGESSSDLRRGSVHGLRRQTLQPVSCFLLPEITFLCLTTFTWWVLVPYLYIWSNFPYSSALQNIWDIWVKWGKIIFFLGIGEFEPKRSNIYSGGQILTYGWERKKPVFKERQEVKQKGWTQEMQRVLLHIFQFSSC